MVAILTIRTRLHLLAVFLVLLTCTLFSSHLHAQKQDQYFSNRSSVPAWIGFRAENRIPQSQWQDWLKESYDLGNQVSFTPMRTEIDRKGVQHQRFQQTLNGDSH